MIIIGLTGGIGCGKSTVCKFLDEFPDVQIFDCDQASKEIMHSEKFKPIAERILGASAFTDGEIDKEKVAAIIFSDEKTKRQFENELHPLVFLELSKAQNTAASQQTQLFFIETAILFETGLNMLCDGTVAVTCNQQTQVARLVNNRQMAETDAKARIKAQMPEDERNQLANLLISTDCQLDELKCRCKYLYTFLLKQQE